MRKHKINSTSEMSHKDMNEIAGGCAWGEGNHECRAQYQTDCTCQTPVRGCSWGSRCGGDEDRRPRRIKRK